MPGRVGKLVKRIIKQGRQIGIDFAETIINDKEHQMEDTECGIYSLYFIISMVKNVDPRKFLTKRISDEAMERLRKVYFN